MDGIESERMLFFQSAIDSAREEFESDNRDAQALTRWGGALIEMAHLHRGEESASLIEEGIAKLNAALSIDPRRHDAFWCLGNAYTSKDAVERVPNFDRRDGFDREETTRDAMCVDTCIEGFLINGDREAALDFFNKALDAFQSAKDLDPENEIYLRALEVTFKAPDIYDEIQRTMMSTPGSPEHGLSLGDEGPSASMFGPLGGRGKKKSGDADFWWDVAGWVCLIGIGLVVMSMAQKPAVMRD